LDLVELAPMTDVLWALIPILIVLLWIRWHWS
jgi:hypothetical protein